MSTGEIKIFQRTYDEVVALAAELQNAFDFLYPRPWGQGRYTLHAPDALQEKWTVWDRELKRTFAFGDSPVDAALSARKRINHEQCQAYKTSE